MPLPHVPLEVVMPRLLLLLLVSLASLPALANPNALPPPVIPQCVGVDVPLTDRATPDLDGLARVGVGWVRVDFFWSSIEKTKGAYDFSAYDMLLAGLTAQHIKPLFTLASENALYGQGPLLTHEARAAFVAFATAVARHYRGRILLWEFEYTPKDTLALTTARAMKAADPNVTLVVTAAPSIARDNLATLFQLGLLKDVDAVAVPYGTADSYQILRLLIHRYAPPGKDMPLISLASADTTPEPSEAQNPARQVLFNLSEGVRLSFLPSLPPTVTDPTFLAAQTLTHTLKSCRFLKRIPLSSPEDYLLLFGHGPNMQILVAWTTGHSHVLSLPVSSIVRLSGTLGNAQAPSIGQGRLRLTLTGSPIYLVVSQDTPLRQAATWAVEPLDAIYTDGQPLRLALTYHDPDAVSHRVRFLIVLMTPDGSRTPMLSGEDIVGPQQSLTLGTASTSFTRLAVRARVGLVVDGVRQPYPQDVTFTPADPLALNVVPLSPTITRAQIENPYGTAFLGQLSAVGPKGFVIVPIHLGSGQTVLTVPVACPAGAAWLLRDRRGRVVASLPARRLTLPLVVPSGPVTEHALDPHLP